MLQFSDHTENIKAGDAQMSRIRQGYPIARQGIPLYSGSAVRVPGAVGVLPNGKISPTTGLQTTGNAFSFVVQGGFSFVWSGSLLTIYWDGTNGSSVLSVKRADGTQITLPRSSIAIASLAGATTYQFAPFVSVAQPQTVSFVAGDSGFPRFAFSPNFPSASLAAAAQTQNLSANEKLTAGFIMFTTGSAGTPTSGGGSAPNFTPYPNQPPSRGGNGVNRTDSEL